MDKKIILAAAVVAGVLIAALGFSLRGCRSVNLSTGISKEAWKLQQQGDWLAAKKAYQQLIEQNPAAKQVMAWQKQIEGLNLNIIFSSIVTPQSIEYTIMPGDSLDKIAKQYKTTVELIKRSNGLVDDNIHPGRAIKVWNAPFNIFVDKSQNILLLKTGEEIVKTYIVATGSNNSTPVGTFRIIEKLPHPTWYKAGAVVPAGSPQNILGTRWMGLSKKGYGIHGTTDPKSLGNQVTAGCVRMANPEVEELYSLVPVGTEVTIVD